MEAGLEEFFSNGERRDMVLARVSRGRRMLFFLEMKLSVHVCAGGSDPGKRDDGDVGRGVVISSRPCAARRSGDMGVWGRVHAPTACLYFLSASPLGPGFFGMILS